MLFLGGLDQIDQQIVQLLIHNARISYSQIGEKTGISRVAARSRVQALEKSGVIEEYTAVINPQKIGGAVSCYFEIECSSETFSDVVRQLEACEIITQIYRVTGRNRLHVHADASYADEKAELVSSVIDTLPGIVSCSTNIILSRIKDIKGLRL